MKLLLILSIKLYQYWISPILGSRCRFYPSCSQYFKEALEKYDLLTACLLGFKRIFRCNPWHAGGFDPLP